MQPFVISIATEKKQFVKDFEKTLQNLGYQYEILGIGHIWKGWKTKMKLCRDKLATMKPNTITIVCDSYDLLFIQKPEEILKKYKKIANNKVLVGLENACPPNCDSKVPEVCNFENPYYPNYKYVNGGFIMGPAYLLLDIYQHQLDNKIEDDQIGLGSWVKNNCNKVIPDYKFEIIANALPRSENSPFRPGKVYTMSLELKIENNKIKFDESFPSVIHMVDQQGDLGVRSEKIRNHLFKNREKFGKLYYIGEDYKKACSASFYYIGYWVPCIIILLLLIVLFCNKINKF